MSQIIIDTGNVADDGTGSTLRQAFSDVNTMFTQVYASGPVDSNVRIANNQIVTTVINQDLIIAPSGIGNLQANARVVPGVDDVYDLGSPTSRWNTLYVGTGGIVADGPVSFGNVFVGNVTSTGNIDANYFIGNGSQLTGVVAASSDEIANGSSGIFAYNSGNIAVSVGNVGNIVVFTETGIVTNGNGNFSGNLSANVITANLFVGNIAGNLSAPGVNTEVLFNDNGQVGAEADFTYNKTTNVLSVAGNINGVYLNGNGVGLTSTLVDHGGDPNNWNTNLKMGVYTVNRTSWSGTTGAPLDSQVYVGLLEVTNSTNTSASQVFYPGAVTAGDVMIQWNRNYFNGVWTGWVKVINDNQVVHGGDF
jgi:hypothetical protein